MDRKNAGAAEPAHGAGYNLAAKCVQTSKQMKAKTPHLPPSIFPTHQFFNGLWLKKQDFGPFVSACAQNVARPAPLSPGRRSGLSRAAFLSILLDKIRNMRYTYSLHRKILPARPPPGGSERLRLFEKPSAHNPPRELGKQRNFFI
jgi:hypothetical protein